MMKITSVKPPPLLPDDVPEMAEPVEGADCEGEDGAEEEGSQSGEAGHAADPRDTDGEEALEFLKKKGASELSLRANWPARYGPLVRIRGTINTYVEELANPEWFQDFVLGTLHALHRRLLKHESNIVGKFTLDYQIAYAQLDSRCSSVIGLHTALKAWVEAQVDMLLQSTLEPFSVIVGYMLHTNNVMSEELNIVLTYATFQEMAIHLKVGRARD
eukprot:7273343-Pyramimonas_sp.AAC.2